MSTEIFSIDDSARGTVTNVLLASGLRDPVAILYDCANPEGFFVAIDKAIVQGKSIDEIERLGKGSFKKSEGKLKPSLALSAREREDFDEQHLFKIDGVTFVLGPLLTSSLVGCCLVMNKGNLSFIRNGITFQSLLSLVSSAIK